MKASLGDYMIFASTGNDNIQKNDNVKYKDSETEPKKNMNLH